MTAAASIPVPESTSAMATASHTGTRRGWSGSRFRAGDAASVRGATKRRKLGGPFKAHRLRLALRRSLVQVAAVFFDVAGKCLERLLARCVGALG